MITHMGATPDPTATWARRVLRRRARERAALQSEVAMTRRILDAIEEYVYVGELLPDDGYELLYQGPCRAKFLALDAEAARVAVWADYVHPDDRELFNAIHAEAVSTGDLDCDYRIVGADGVERWVRDRGRVITEDGRNFLYGSVLDVTAIHRAREELEAARAEADRLGRIDPLTGVANRRALPELLDRRLERDETAVGVLLLDIDRFKQINDAYGHGAGDAVLVETARRVRETVREDDAVARVGGEEFLVLLYGMSDADVLRRLGEAVRAALASTPMLVGEGVETIVTASIGAALSGYERGTSESLLAAADRALYSAKRGGRNRVVLFGDLAPEVARDMDSDELRLARALAVAACAREGVSEGHLDEVGRLAAAVAARLGAPPALVARCRLGGLVHDVGKAAVPDRVVLKPGPLDDVEWAEMREHPALGEALVSRIPELRDVAPAVRHHHERWDGGGYPDGLEREAIPLEARILAAVDSFSAITADRPYRAARSREEALEELRRVAGSQLDPAVVEALEAVLPVAVTT